MCKCVICIICTRLPCGKIFPYIYCMYRVVMWNIISLHILYVQGCHMAYYFLTYIACTGLSCHVAHYFLTCIVCTGLSCVTLFPYIYCMYRVVMSCGTLFPYIYFMYKVVMFHIISLRIFYVQGCYVSHYFLTYIVCTWFSCGTLFHYIYYMYRVVMCHIISLYILYVQGVHVAHYFLTYIIFTGLSCDVGHYFPTYIICTGMYRVVLCHIVSLHILYAQAQGCYVSHCFPKCLQSIAGLSSFLCW